MSQYSEMMGSFIRTGNYPMEANYVFPTEAALKEFYSDPINATTIHKGLFKIVENGGDGKQALYWVVQKQTNDELEFVKLIENIDINNINEQLEDLQTRLEEEIDNRKKSETAIWGTNDPTNVPEEFNSILDLATELASLIQEVSDIHKELIDSDDSIKKSLKTEIKAIAGTQEDNIVEYLKTLPYKSLTEAANALDKFLNTMDNTSNQINTLPELKFFLEGYTDTQKLRHVLLDLQAEILGNPIPSEDFRTLRAIEDFVRILKADSENTDKNLQSELDNTQVGIGLSGDGSYNSDTETYYLKDATSVMNALKILDSLMYEAISGITIQASNTDVVDLNIRKELEGYVIGAKLNLSNVIGNDLIKKEDGLYFNVKSTYNNGTLSLYVNDKLIAQHVLGFSSIVESAYYDPTQESILIVFKLLNGEKQTITVPVGTLIRELVVDNDQPGKVVELTRETVIDGPDKLSADVRIYNDKHNILKKIGNSLSVDGTSDSITHNDETLSTVLETIKSTVSTNNTAVNNKIDSEIARAKAEETAIKESIENLKDSTSESIADLNLKDQEIQSSLSNEINRATEAENNLKASVQDLKDSDSAIKQSIEGLKVTVNGNSLDIAKVQNNLDLEIERAQNAETVLDQRVTSIEGEVSSTSQAIADEVVRATAKESELATAIETETSRASAAESSLQSAIDTEVSRAQTKEDALEQRISQVETKSDETLSQLQQEVVRATQKESELSTSISAETSRATTEELVLKQGLATLNDKLDSTKADVNTNSQNIVTLQTGLTALDSKVDLQKEQLSQEIHLLSDGIDEKIAGKADKTVIDAIDQKANDNAAAISAETLRATQKEGELQSAINTLSTNTDTKVADLNTKISDEVTRAKGVEGELQLELAKKVESVALNKIDDLTYTILVNGAIIGQISIPEDQFLESVQVVNETILRFTFNTSAGTTTTDIDIKPIIEDALATISARVDALETSKAPIDSPTFIGIPQVLTSPDAGDSSQRIPSTNWVRDRITETVNAAIIDIYYTKAEMNQILNSKADLVNGTVPLEQLPVTYWIDVE